MCPSPSESERAIQPGQNPATIADLDDFVLTDNFSHLLRRAHFRAEAIFDEHLRDFQTTPRQKALLMTSYQNPGATINQLADGINLDRNSTTEMLDRLVQRGLLMKQRSPTDRRAWQVDITDAGREFLLNILPGDREVEEMVLEPVPPEYRPLLVKCLRLLSGLDE